VIVAKVDFKLNDALLRRQAPSSPDEEPAPKREPHPGPTRRPAATVAELPTRSSAAEPSPDVATSEPRARRATIQTSVLLPPTMWDRLLELAREAGGLASPNRLLIDILVTGPQSVQDAADDLEHFLQLPAAQSAVGEPWEERNLRLPVDLRRRLDDHRRILSEAGVPDATRARLIAATVHQRGPAPPKKRARSWPNDGPRRSVKR
jgi:hypothetical protein